VLAGRSGQLKTDADPARRAIYTLRAGDLHAGAQRTVCLLAHAQRPALCALTCFPTNDRVEGGVMASIPFSRAVRLLVVCLSLLPALSAESADAPTTATILVPARSESTALDQSIQVEMNGTAAVSCDDIDLFVENKSGLVQCTAGPSDRVLLFTLSRDAADADQSNRRTWAAILGSPLSPTKEVNIVVRSASKPLLIQFKPKDKNKENSAPPSIPATHAAGESAASAASAALGASTADETASTPVNASGNKTKTVTVLTIKLHVFNGILMIIVLLLVLLVVACTIVVLHMGLGRDSGIPQMRIEKLPFSLGRCQMAFWFMLTFWAFCFMYALVGQTDTLNAESLMLMGISAGTALTSIAIDKSKNETVNIEKAVNALGLTSRWHVELLHDIVFPDERKPLSRFLRNGVRAMMRSREQRDQSRRPELQDIKPDTRIADAPIRGFDSAVADTYKDLWDKYDALIEPIRSNGFIADLVTDASGPTIGRWQILIWTVTLGMVYIISTWQRLELPEFGTTLLTLMGISSGVYLGFKVPEKQVPDAQSQKPAETAKNTPPVRKPNESKPGDGKGKADDDKRKPGDDTTNSPSAQQQAGPATAASPAQEAADTPKTQDPASSSGGAQ